jgi:predicted Zn-ribbon and HTH transcriptional regulator
VVTTTSRKRRQVEVIDLARLPKKEVKKVAAVPYKCGGCGFGMLPHQNHCANCGVDWIYRIAQ